MPIVIVLLAALLATVMVPALPADAQPVKIETTRKAPERETPHIVPPPLHYEVTRPRDNDYYPRGTLIEYDPAFIEPFAASYQTPTGSGRYGFSGWSSPNPPIGSESARNGHEDPGVLSLGFSVTWDGPPPRVVPALRPR